MDNDYWSIDAIYAQYPKMDCTFIVDVPNLGHLDGGDQQNITAPLKMQLPFWMASVLIDNGFAEYRIPQPFSLRIRKALNADARSVKLAGLVGVGSSWYGFGKAYSDLWAFRERLVEIVDQAQHFGFASVTAGSAAGRSGEPTGNAKEFREGLESAEREIFLLIQQTAQQTKVWLDSSDKRR
ncbi:GINS complex, Psf3 component [Cantharellus anzutake]|uniref:GINS complex, Psf3 component n=1 Tax=Cantharellus anzutake TaxID=1750568 RepID=UPI001905295C|nr:GINS complex, Psf3 component [Cantharellus anzutake]KAF8339179.1 GINS complex, Psf3 component [Cantharellus anzutake]